MVQGIVDVDRIGRQEVAAPAQAEFATNAVQKILHRARQGGELPKLLGAKVALLEQHVHIEGVADVTNLRLVCPTIGLPNVEFAVGHATMQCVRLSLVRCTR